MLARYTQKSAELRDLSKRVEDISSDIVKQTSILDRLNAINNEKGRRITEIERYLDLKKQTARPMPQPKQTFQKTFEPGNHGFRVNTEKSFNIQQRMHESVH